MREIVVLSLFDGISCGRVALENLGIKVKTYYASEVDKYAIKVTQKNYPDTIQMGDITQWRTWDIDWSKIDFILAGSPCTQVSRANRTNEGDKGIFGKDSILFFEFVNILNHIKQYNSDVKFLLENVKMNKEYQDIISKEVGTNCVLVNSALVSAQSRERLYWTNWDFELPEDRGILLKDILLEDDLDELMHTDKAIEYMNRKVKDGRNHWDFMHHSDIRNDKSATVVANFLKGVPYNVLIDTYGVRKFHPIECERLQTLPDNYTAEISNTQRYKCIGNGWTVEIIMCILSQALQKFT